MSLNQNGTWDPVVFDEIRAGIVALWKAAYGATADTDPETRDGVLISIISMQLMLTFDTGTSLWANSFFRSAVGQSLDNILDLFAKRRSPASSSIGSTIFYGAPLTVVPAATTVLTSDQAANRFATDAIATVGAASSSTSWMARMKTPVAVGDSYILQIDANPAQAYVALGGDKTTDIARELRDLLNLQGFSTAALAGVEPVTGSGLLAIEFTGVGNVSATFTGAADLDALEAVRATVTSLAAGPVLAPAGTLQSLSNPIVGIAGASNDVDATPGAARQSDDEFRAAHSQTVFANSARTDQGMQAAVSALGLTPTTGVLENLVVSNRTVAPVDSFGRPIGSVENIILQDGSVDDVDIANAVARQIPAGVQPYGLRSFGQGTTIDGEIIEVFATDVEELFLHLEITVTKGEGFPIGGDVGQAISTATANYFAAGQISTSSGVSTDASARLVTGKDMLRSQVASPVNSVTNNSSLTIVTRTDVTALPTDVPVFAAVDQPATDRQIVRADASRIAAIIL